MVSAYQVTVKFVIFYSVHILQLDITNKKDIENVVSFITDTVGSEGKCHIVFLLVYDSNESKMPFMSVTCLFTETMGHLHLSEIGLRRYAPVTWPA